MTDKEIIKKWLRDKLGELCLEIQCEVSLLPKDVIEGKIFAIKETLSFIDSLQEEPKGKVWHDMSEPVENGRNILITDPKDFYGAVLRKGGTQLKNSNKERYEKWAYVEELIKL